MWNEIKREAISSRYFSFSDIVFSALDFSNDDANKVLSTKMRLKKVDKARFRFVNDVVNESFGIFNLAFEFVENGNYKG